MRHGGKPSGAWRRRFLAPAAVLIVIVAVTSACAKDKKPPSPPTDQSESAILRSFGPNLEVREGGDFGLDRIELERASKEPFSTYLRVQYPKNSGSNQSAREDGTSPGGAQVYLRSAEMTDHAFLRYRVRFPEGFDFVKGGKLPGLYGGTATSGGDIPDGTNGFSTRFMWRTHGAAEVYAYLPTSEEHGTSLGRGSWTWPTGRWACVEQEVALNDPGKSNGLARVWLDDKKVLEDDALTYRSTASLRIEGLFFSTFFGGGDASWATPRGQFTDFADFQLSTARVGC